MIVVNCQLRFKEATDKVILKKMEKYNKKNNKFIQKKNYKKILQKWICKYMRGVVKFDELHFTQAFC